jgi:type VI secretion system secreted protein VgrG
MTIHVTLTFEQPPSGALSVVQWELVDSVSELFELNVGVLSQNPEIDLRTIVGKGVVVAFAGQPHLREVSGLVRRVRQLTSMRAGASLYELTIAPMLWLTTRRQDHAIYQDLDARELFEAISARYGSRVGLPLSSIGRVLPKHEYRVQYGETDHDFVYRALADDGITSFFDHPQGSTLRLLDDTSAKLLDEEATVLFEPPAGAGMNKGPHLSSVEVVTMVETTEVDLRDYDFEKPAFFPRGHAEEPPRFDNEGGLVVYEYGVGEFSDEKTGDALAKQQLEERRAERRLFRCEASFAVYAGMHLSIANHPREDVNGRVFVLRSHARVDGSTDGEPRARFVFECIPAGRPFRPRRRPKPRIHGTQTAFVVGNKIGVDEIDVDKHGRVKVQFRWDRRDLFEGRPTRHVRVSQGWAGRGFGLVLLPRVGDEVVVSYLDGDPDEPIIIGRVHNGVYTSPLNLPAEKTRSIWRSRSSPGGAGYNEIMMEDKAGAELLELHAHRDFQHDTGHDAKVTVGGNQTVGVAGGQSTSADTISMRSAKKTDVYAGTNLNLTACETLRAEAAVDVNVMAGTQITIKAGSLLEGQAPTIILNAGANASILAGADLLVWGSGDVKVVSDSALEVTAPTVNVHGTGNVNIKGDGTVNVSGGTVNVSGGTVKIGGGTVDINGGAVNLNC